ncbi:unnamed protein product [Porites lobata]|uniref:F5/8 type C domain-containing protein n=1 Tax=Porites lobata TaxID=104759 RepID=A0ABN8QCX9_9CNID|nr:unnamed protein product [Porites lobata]
MEKGAISDGQISASSQLNANHEASQGRLNLKGSWSAYANDAKQWLQIDLGSNRLTVTRVATQGSNFQSQWVINYTLKYSDDGLNFQLYKQQGQSEHKVFVGNTDENTIVYNELNGSIVARYTRFQPTAWHNQISMRVELYGCKGNHVYGRWFLDGSDPDVGYFGTVNHTKGWCPGSKAATFSQNSSYATVPNINITTCDFTIAFWVKYIGVDGPILALWSKGGKLFYVTVKNSRLILSIHNAFDLQINYWNHVAVTCQLHKIKVFVNGTEEALRDEWDEYFFSSLGRYQSEYIIGNDPDFVQMPMASGVFVGAVMDLYVTGIALSGRQVYDLSKGESSIEVSWKLKN